MADWDIRRISFEKPVKSSLHSSNIAGADSHGNLFRQSIF